MPARVACLRCALLLLKLHRLIRQAIQFLLEGNLVAHIRQLPFVLQRFFLVSQQRFFLRRQLATASGFFQNRILVFRLPQVLSLLTDNVVNAGMLLQRFQLGLKGEKFGLRLFLGFVPCWR